MIFAAIPRTLMMALSMTIPADELGNVWMLFACFNKVKGCHKKKEPSFIYMRVGVLRRIGFSRRLHRSLLYARTQFFEVTHVVISIVRVLNKGSVTGLLQGGVL